MGRGGKRLLSLWVPEEEYQRVRRRAFQGEETISNLLRRAVEREVAEQGSTTPTAGRTAPGPPPRATESQGTPVREPGLDRAGRAGAPPAREILARLPAYE